MTPPPRLPEGWRDLRRLGAGRLGTVYRGVDPGGAAVAIKVLAPALAADPEAARRFAAEYDQLKGCEHPGLPRARGQGHTADGAPFYAMDLVLGADAAEDAPLPPICIRGVIVGVAEVLAHLHAQGLVHGDVKAANVRVGPDRGVKVIGLGPAVAVTPQSDLYALGVLGYLLRTGRAPFPPQAAGETAALTGNQRSEAPPPVRAPEADPGLDALIADLLALEADARPASAHAVLARLAGEALSP